MAPVCRSRVFLLTCTKDYRPRLPDRFLEPSAEWNTTSQNRLPSLSVFSESKISSGSPWRLNSSRSDSRKRGTVTAPSCHVENCPLQHWETSAGNVPAGRRAPRRFMPCLPPLLPIVRSNTEIVVSMKKKRFAMQPIVHTPTVGVDETIQHYFHVITTY